MGLFANAQSKTSTKKSTTKKKATVFTVGVETPGPEPEAVGKAITALTSLNSDYKAIAGKMTVLKGAIKKYAEKMFLSQYAAQGVHPETPIQVQNADGEKVTYVVQDRSSQNAAKPEQLDALGELLGPDAAEDCTYTQNTFKLNPVILALPGVMEHLEPALESCFEGMVEDGTLTAEQVGDLLACDQMTAFKPGTVQQLANICGRDTQKMEEFLGVMGSAWRSIREGLIQRVTALPSSDTFWGGGGLFFLLSFTTSPRVPP